MIKEFLIKKKARMETLKEDTPGYILFYNNLERQMEPEKMYFNDISGAVKLPIQGTPGYMSLLGDFYILKTNEDDVRRCLSTKGYAMSAVKCTIPQGTKVLRNAILNEVLPEKFVVVGKVDGSTGEVFVDRAVATSGKILYFRKKVDKA